MGTWSQLAFPVPGLCVPARQGNTHVADFEGGGGGVSEAAGPGRAEAGSAQEADVALAYAQLAVLAHERRGPRSPPASSSKQITTTAFMCV